MTKLNNIAHQKFWTVNPGTNELVNNIIKPLTIKVNKPRVRIFKGRVKIIRIGLIIVLMIPKMTATVMAVRKLLMKTPGKI